MVTLAPGTSYRATPATLLAPRLAATSMGSFARCACRAVFRMSEKLANQRKALTEGQRPGEKLVFRVGKFGLSAERCRQLGYC